MYTTFHFRSADDINAEIMDEIKAAFKSKPVTITVEEDQGYPELTMEMQAILDERLEEEETNYLSSEESINQLNRKYGL